MKFNQLASYYEQDQTHIPKLEGVQFSAKLGHRHWSLLITHLYFSFLLCFLSFFLFSLSVFLSCFSQRSLSYFFFLSFFSLFLFVMLLTMISFSYFLSFIFFFSSCFSQ